MLFSPKRDRETKRGVCNQGASRWKPKAKDTEDRAWDVEPSSGDRGNVDGPARAQFWDVGLNKFPFILKDMGSGEQF